MNSTKENSFRANVLLTVWRKRESVGPELLGPSISIFNEKRQNHERGENHNSLEAAENRISSTSSSILTSPTYICKQDGDAKEQ